MDNTSENKMEHKFSVEYAKKWSVDEAIVLRLIIYFVSLNRSKGINYRYGHYWMFCSIKKLTTDYQPYFSKGQYRTIIKNLIKNGVIIAADLNKNGWVNPNWYAVKDETMLLDIFPAPQDKLDLKDRKQLNIFIKGKRLEISTQNLSDNELREKIRTSPNLSLSDKNALKINYPNIENEWYYIGDDFDRLFESIPDEFDKMDFDELRKFIKQNKLRIVLTAEMDIDNVRNEIRFCLRNKFNIKKEIPTEKRKSGSWYLDDID